MTKGEQEKLVQSTIKAAKAAVAEFGSDLYGFFLFTTDEFSFVSCSVFTEASHAKAVEDRIQQHPEKYSTDDAGKNLAARWRWEYDAAVNHYAEDMFADSLLAIGSAFDKAVEADEELDPNGPYDRHLASTEAAMITALRRLTFEEVLPENVLIGLKTNDQSHDELLAYATLFSRPEFVRRVRSDLTAASS